MSSFSSKTRSKSTPFSSWPIMRIWQCWELAETIYRVWFLSDMTLMWKKLVLLKLKSNVNPTRLSLRLKLLRFSKRKGLMLITKRILLRNGLWWKLRSLRCKHKPMLNRFTLKQTWMWLSWQRMQRQDLKLLKARPLHSSKNVRLKKSSRQVWNPRDASNKRWSWVSLWRTCHIMETWLLLVPMDSKFWISTIKRLKWSPLTKKQNETILLSKIL